MNSLFPLTIIGTVTSKFEFWALVCRVVVINALILAVYTAAITLTIKACL